MKHALRLWRNGILFSFLYGVSYRYHLSWSHMRWLLLTCQASSPTCLPLTILSAIFDSLEVLAYVILSNASVSFCAWSFCLERLPRARSKNSYLFFQFYLRYFCEAFSHLPLADLGAPLAPRKRALCISALKLSCIILISIPGSWWIVNSLRAEIEFPCVHNQPGFLSIHIHLPVLFICPLLLHAYLRWFQNMVTDV